MLRKMQYLRKGGLNEATPNESVVSCFENLVREGGLLSLFIIVKIPFVVSFPPYIQLLVSHSIFCNI